MPRALRQHLGDGGRHRQRMIESALKFLQMAKQNNRVAYSETKVDILSHGLHLACGVVTHQLAANEKLPPIPRNDQMRRASDDINLNSMRKLREW